MAETLLFQRRELRDYLKAQRDSLVSEVKTAEEQYLLNADAEEWTAYLADKFRIEVPVLLADQLWAEDEGETQVDVSYDTFQRDIRDPSTPTYVAGRAITVHIPFEGWGYLFELQASTFTHNPPRARIGNQELLLRFVFPHDRRPAIQTLVQQLVDSVEQHLLWQRGDVEGFNAQLENDARQAIAARRQRVLADHEHLDNLGIPIKKREDAPTTYAAPGITRRAAPQAPQTATRAAPKALEPTLVGDFYEHICEVVRSMGHSMERTPDPYAGWDEERLRDGLLVMLNSHYQGQAMGEVFQRAGKTDILVRILDRNVFVGECKWWSGQSDFTKAVNQLFSYSTWRDTKLALVMFVAAKRLTAIIDKGQGALGEHPEFASWGDNHDETELRATMTWPGDPDRHATLTVFFFHLTESAQ